MQGAILFKLSSYWGSVMDFESETWKYGRTAIEKYDVQKRLG